MFGRRIDGADHIVAKAEDDDARAVIQACNDWVGLAEPLQVILTELDFFRAKAASLRNREQQPVDRVILNQGVIVLDAVDREVDPMIPGDGDETL